MSGVRMFDYLIQYHGLREEVLAAIERVLESGQLILGPEVERFEGRFTAYLRREGASVGVNSGTDALVVALRALDVGPGDEVITVPNTAVPTVSAIREVGAIPVFCDVDLGSALMDLDQVEERITDRTKAVIPVHLYGNVVDVERLREILGERPVRVLEDCAQAHGARRGERLAGTMGDAAAFSFYPTKNLGAYGDGGLCFAPTLSLGDRMRSIRMYGFEGQYYAEREGQNSRLDELQAAILNVKLGHLDEHLDRRRALARRYDERLAPAIRRIRHDDDVHPAYHLYVTRVGHRTVLREKLAAAGIGTGVHYAHPIHLMRAYGFLGHERGDFPNSERLAEEVLSLPLYPELGEDAIDEVIDAFNRITDELGALEP